jgi:MFS family permease
MPATVTSGPSPRATMGFLYLGQALLTMASGAVFALLAEHQDQKTLPGWSLGLIAAATFVGNVAMQITFARFADRGHTRWLLRAGLLCAGLGMIGFAFASGVGGFVGARLLTGAGEGLYGPAARRVVVYRNPQRTAEALGRMGAVAVGGFILGPPLATFLLEIEGIRAPFFVLLAVLAICVPAIARIAEPPPEPVQSRAAVRRLLRNRHVHAALMLGAALQVMFGAFEALWSRFFKDLGATPTFIGVSLALFPIPLILLSPFGGRLADRHGARQAAVVANLASVPFVIAFGFASTPWLVASLAFVNGVTQAVSMPGGQAAMARASPLELLAVGQGLYGAVGAIAAAIAAVGAAASYAAFGPRPTFTATSLVVVALSLGSYLWGNSSPGDEIDERSRAHSD